MQPFARAGLIAGLLAALSGCASKGLTPIGSLLHNPAYYNGKTVEIEGQVLEPASNWGVTAYQIRDSTGIIQVVTAATPPATGTQVAVKGKFKPVFGVGTRSAIVIREESRSDQSDQ
jgi:aspartyl-tRNA synthetase